MAGGEGRKLIQNSEFGMGPRRPSSCCGPRMPNSRLRIPMLGLYIHVPFCSAICNYCNFNRGLFDAALKDRYVDALVAEIAEAGPLAQDGQDPADTIYFGGGTTSLLEPDEVGRIIEACESSFAVAPDPEITLEANPETVTMPKLAAFRQAGVNRLS